MIGNDVLLKCAIPSFLADFLSVAGWVGSEGAQISANQNYHLGNFWRTRYICAFSPALDCKEALDPCASSSFNDQVQLCL